MQVLRKGLFHAISLLKGLPSLPGKTEWIITDQWTWKSLGYNEEDAAKDGRHDVDILVEVDKSQTDDQLVMKMCSALGEMHTTPPAMLDFVLKIINLRLDTNHSGTEALPSMLDLTQLPVQTCTILMDTVADILRRELRRFPVSEPIEYSDWMHNCLSLLVARLPCLLSDKALDVAALCFAGTQSVRGEKTVDEIVKSVEEKDRVVFCLHLQERFRYAFLDYNGWQLLDTMYNIMKKCCCKCPDHDSDEACSTIETVLKRHEDTIPDILKENTCDVITGYMLHQVKAGKPWTEWHREIVLILFKQYDGKPKATWHGGLKEVARLLLTKPKYAPNFFRHMYHRSDFETSCENMFGDTLPTSTGE